MRDPNRQGDPNLQSDPEPNASPSAQPAPPATSSPLFTPSPTKEGGLPLAAWGIAGLAVLLILGALIFASRRHSGGAANTALPLDPYAQSLPISGVAMSESTSLSGGKSTFIDGHIRNAGTKPSRPPPSRSSSATRKACPPPVETLPISLVRTREPYVDTQPISAAPLKPGDDREFRLIFETIPANWNVQIPEIHIIRVTTQ